MNLDFLLRVLERLQVQWESETLFTTLGIGFLIVFIAFLADLLVRKILLQQVHRILGHLANSHSESKSSGDLRQAIDRFSRIVPALIIKHGLHFDPTIEPDVLLLIGHLCEAFIVFTTGHAVIAILSAVDVFYSRRSYAKTRPIKGYIQLLKILVVVVTLILVVSAFLGKSPTWILGGLGAIAAVLMLIFQDTILSFAASIQINSNDIIRVGDWVEIPGQGVDGEVIDIALYTIQVQNWDKTYSTIPTCKLITQPFKNWRGMRESGGRRIKRAILIDQSTVRFLEPVELVRFSAVKLLKEDLAAMEAEAYQWNSELGDFANDPLNKKRITNIGLFRLYALRYIENHPRIRHDRITMVRHLDPNAGGIPIEIYCFTNTIEWVPYEGIQSEIFDHLLAVLTEFGLQVAQNPTSVDLADCLNKLADRTVEGASNGIKVSEKASAGASSFGAG